MLEKTLVLLKPDALKRKLVGEVISRYEKKNLTIEGIKIVYPTEEMLLEHYKNHHKKDFFPDLILYMRSGPVMALLLSGEQAIEVVRKLNGDTDFMKAEPGTIRGDYSFSARENLVHSSDSIESAKHEISIWFENNK